MKIVYVEKQEGEVVGPMDLASVQVAAKKLNREQFASCLLACAGVGTAKIAARLDVSAGDVLQIKEATLDVMGFNTPEALGSFMYHG